jgi:hypothetical protein
VPKVQEHPPLGLKTSRGGPLGGVAGGPGASATWLLKTSMVSPLGGDAGGPGAPTTYLEDVNGPPWEAMPEVRERPSPILKTSMAGPLRGDAGGSGAPTTYLEDVDGGAPVRRCRRSESAHHLC